MAPQLAQVRMEDKAVAAFFFLLILFALFLPPPPPLSPPPLTSHPIVIFSFLWLAIFGTMSNNSVIGQEDPPSLLKKLG